MIDGGAAGPVISLHLYDREGGDCCGPRGCWPCPAFYRAKLKGLTIRNGAGASGGGVEQRSGWLVLEDCVIEQNVADSGGGIFAAGPALEYQTGLQVRNSVVRDNVADVGGGVYVEWLQAVITTTTISGNSGSPSAVYQYHEYYPLELDLSVVNGNVGGSAIAVASYSGYECPFPSLSRSTISGNTGAGVEGWGASIRSCTITGNEVGIDVDELYLRDSIVADNDQADCALISSGGSGGHNLFGSSCVGSGSWDPDPTDIETTDPLLFPLADNGGPTLTHALHPDSPAIDAGSDYCLWRDQRGVLRPQDGDGDGIALCDIGAFEFAPPLARVNELIDQVLSIGLHHGIENSLLAKLNAATLILGDLEDDNDHAAANVLGAFIRQVQAQYGKKIAAGDADGLIEAAEEIIELLSGDMRIRRDEFRRRLFSPGKRLGLGSGPQEPE